MSDFFEGLLPEFFSAVTQDLRHHLVSSEDAPVEIDLPDSYGGLLEDRAEACFAGAQRLFSLLAGGDVIHRQDHMLLPIQNQRIGADLEPQKGCGAVDLEGRLCLRVMYGLSGTQRRLKGVADGAQSAEESMSASGRICDGMDTSQIIAGLQTVGG